MSNDDTTDLPTTWPELKDPEQLDKILDIIAAEGNVERERITPEATLESLGLESMDVVMILMGIEDKLGTYLPMDAELSSARNLAELIGAIDNSMSQGAAGPESTPS